MADDAAQDDVMRVDLSGEDDDGLNSHDLPELPDLLDQEEEEEEG
jgi:hypothetical protein